VDDGCETCLLYDDDLWHRCFGDEDARLCQPYSGPTNPICYDSFQDCGGGETGYEYEIECEHDVQEGARWWGSCNREYPSATQSGISWPPCP
jgi:hypothetical protein